MGKNVLVGQSGGPTAVINSSLAGIFQAAQSRGAEHIYGMLNGIQGLFEERYVDLSEIITSTMQIELLKRTPSSFLGSCRYKLPDPEKDEVGFIRLFELFERLDIGYFFYIGGNDSMDTINKLTCYAEKIGSVIRMIGVPKTIDNDLFGTDHSPGYGSAAKYIATSCMEIYHDTHVYDVGKITVLEIMGRNAGWLTGASAIASYMGAGPDLIYLPEVAFDPEKFLFDVSDIYNRKKTVLVAASEGIMDKEGKYMFEYGNSFDSEIDSFGHTQMGGLASKLAGFVNQKTGISSRGIELSLLQRCAAHCASKTDYDESYNAGAAAVRSALTGETDKMVSFERDMSSGNYKCNIKLAPLEIVAGKEKTVPISWINERHNGVTEEFIDYALPLIQGETELINENGLPKFAKLKKIVAK